MILAIGLLLIVLLIFFLVFGVWGTIVAVVLVFGILFVVKFLLNKGDVLRQ